MPEITDKKHGKTAFYIGSAEKRILNCSSIRYSYI